MKKISLFIFHNDLRLSDNKALSIACKSPYPVLLYYVFDPIFQLNSRQRSFVYQTLTNLNKEAKKYNSTLRIDTGNTFNCLQTLSKQYQIEAIFHNESYNPFYQNWASEINHFAYENKIQRESFKDAVIFEKDEILSNTSHPYKVFSAYKKKWKNKANFTAFPEYIVDLQRLIPCDNPFPIPAKLNIIPLNTQPPFYRLQHLEDYEMLRDFPALDATSRLSPFLRFGIVSPRFIIKHFKKNTSLLDELIWREFFYQIMYHYPESIDYNFKRNYDNISWINNEEEYLRWCNGTTGYPIVDAGMRELNQTGYMHNRTRMITASFLCKHLLIDWRIGEHYFATQLLDYDPALNTGNWQWVAGTGCDAMPYFRVFNPTQQQKKFDSKKEYIEKWIPEIYTSKYPKPMVDHAEARERAILAYKLGRQN
jgi:deoxyribodipyrimidine photo-lyase